ncbi:MAG: hypothetical protein K9L78_02310 [Victivallales bacterium]|nr:hypothetical protein [Victivallales bacterium]
MFKTLSHLVNFLIRPKEQQARLMSTLNGVTLRLCSLDAFLSEDHLA